MRKQLFIVLILSLFFININSFKCDDVKVKNENKNENMGVATPPGDVGSTGTTVGDFQQALKLSVYDENDILRESKYLIIRQGVQSQIDVYCSTNQYNFSKINSTAAKYCGGSAFSYLNIDGISMFKDKSSPSYGYWTTYIANSKSIEEVLWDNDRDHQNLWNILDAMNIDPKDGYYLIVEPVVTVKCNGKIYSGTINSLMQANVSFLSSGHISGNACGFTSNDNFVFYYSVIGQSFKSSGAGSCNTVSTWNKNLGNMTLYPTTKESNYTGCGYNKYDLSKITKSSCKITSNPTERIKKYKELMPDNGMSSKSYRNILNFTIDPKSDNACGEAELYTTNKSCLYLGSKSEFNEKNLSGYTYITEINGKTAYCNNSIKLNSNVGDSWTSKAGMAFIGGREISTTVATSTATLTCYLYDNNINYIEKNSDPFYTYRYSDLISGIKLDNKDLTPKVINSNQTEVTEGTYLGANYLKYEKVITVSYEAPKVYKDKNTGETVGSESANKIERYGLYSEFTEKVSRDVPYSIVFGNKANLRINEALAKCKYTPSDGIIETKPKLEFRTIDTTKAFIGESGKGRTVGANWCSKRTDGSWDCSSENDLIKEIMNRNNSYNIKKTDPKYKFVLTPSVITKIRNYNKEVPLDKHEKCSNNICTNPFFNEIKDSIKIGSDKLVK